jgi:hypothetical protein
MAAKFMLHLAIKRQVEPTNQSVNHPTGILMRDLGELRIERGRVWGLIAPILLFLAQGLTPI